MLSLRTGDLRGLMDTSEAPIGLTHFEQDIVLNRLQSLIRREDVGKKVFRRFLNGVPVEVIDGTTAGTAVWVRISSNQNLRRLRLHISPRHAKRL